MSFPVQRIAVIAALGTSSLLTGCASIVSGTNQIITVEAKNQGTSVVGANCKLENSKGTFYVTTPGTVTVHRAYGDLSIKCEKDGLSPGIATVKSTTKAMAFGNVIFGGAIGVAVDTSSGAAYDYPDLIQIIMGQTNINGSAVPSTAAVSTAQTEQPNNGAGSTPAGATATPIQGTPAVAATSAFQERQLSGEEMTAHFSQGRVAHSPNRRLTYDFKSNGDIEFTNHQSHAFGQGVRQLNAAENQICIHMYTQKFHDAQGCYRMFQTDAKKFELRSTTDTYKIRYVVD